MSLMQSCITNKLTAEERNQWGVKDEEDDQEISVGNMEELTDAVTLPYFEIKRPLTAVAGGSHQEGSAEKKKAE